MIGYSCTNCGHTCSVQDDYSGKRIKCPRCSFVGVVVDDSGRIKITCQNCGNENNVPEILVGKEIQCPKCSNPVKVLSLKKESSENIDDYLFEKIPEKSEKSKISDKNLIIIISVAVAFIVLGQITITIVTAPYKSRKARKTQNLQSQRQINDNPQTERNFQDSGEKTLRIRDVLKLDKRATIICIIAISCIILLFCRMYWCPECRKMWAMKKINPFNQVGGINESICKYCGYRKRIP